MSLDGASIRAAIASAETPSPFSGVVRVQQGAEVIFQKGYGFANRAERIPNTPHTRFGIASGGKGFTAVAVMQLVQAGKLSLETRLADCVDAAFPRFDPGITLSHLLSHTSGIPDYCDEELGDDFEALWLERPSYTMRTPRDFLPMFQERPMKFTPGERFSYSNAGFILLGLAVEQAAGQPYTEYVTQHVLASAGMADSGFFALDRLPARTALGYIEEEDGGWRTNLFALPVIGGPDGGVFTTAPDMAAFWAALRSGRLLDPALVAAMFTPRVATNDKGGAYGLGCWLKRQGETVTDCTLIGSDPGVAFLSTVLPGADIQITVIGNTSDPAWAVYDAIRAAVG